jgi:hypothetical protein
MLLWVRHIILFFARKGFTTIWRCWSVSCLKWSLSSTIYSSSNRWMRSCHSTMHCFILSCSCCRLQVILIICTCSVVERATSTHVYWRVVIVNHAFCMSFTWCPKVVLIVSAVPSLKVMTTLSKYWIFKILMICHRLHEIVVLGNKSVIVSSNLNLICILEMITVDSTRLSSFIISKWRLGCSQLLLSDLLLICNCSIIIYGFHVFCYYIILTWHLVIRLSYFYNIVIQIIICCASWNISKIIFASFILSNWLSLSIIRLFSSRMICCSIRIICRCNYNLLICVISVETIF